MAVLLAGGLWLLRGPAEASLLAGWQQGPGPEQLAGPAAAAEPVTGPAAGVVAQGLAVAAAAAAAAAAASVAGEMLPLKGSAWMEAAVTAVALELPADLAAAAGILALAAVQRALSGPAGSPSCSQRHDGTLTVLGMAGSIQRS